VLLAFLTAGFALWGYRRIRWWRNERRLADLPGMWERIVSEGARLHVPHRPGQTVREYAEAVSEALGARAAAARWRRDRWTDRAAEAGEALREFASLYGQYLYGDGPATTEAGWGRLADLLARLRWVPLRALVDRAGDVL
jgi:hypothetical protein